MKRLLYPFFYSLFLFLVQFPVIAQTAMSDGIASATTIDEKTIIYCLWDAKTNMPGKIFFHASDKTPVKNCPANIPASINVFILEDKDGIIMIDTGYGAARNLLSKMSISEKDISFILLTHVHPDHIGGLLTDEGKVAYPSAKLYLSVLEVESLKNPNHKMHDSWKKIESAYKGRIHTFDYGSKNLPGNMEAVAAQGHTPGHTVFRKTITKKIVILRESRNGKEELQTEHKQELLFIGDLIHGAALQFENPDICAKFDMNSHLAVQSRINILKEAVKTNVAISDIGTIAIPTLIFGAHLPFPGYGTVLIFEPGSSRKITSPSNKSLSEPQTEKNKDSFQFIGVEP